MLHSSKQGGLSSDIALINDLVRKVNDKENHRGIFDSWILKVRQMALLFKELRIGFKVKNLRFRWMRKGDFARV